ncbi:RsmB/NOP family class I SAM-dependent RNA methyltransferase [Flexibacter flexilis]|nr:methyltransferase domain-containing protein [Flexibacter flexilis]
MVRLHSNLVEAVVQSLLKIFAEHQYADKVVEQTLKSDSRWGARDRAFVAENIYEMVRWWRLLWAVYGQAPDLTAEQLHQLFGVHWLLKGHTLPDKPIYQSLSQTDWNARRAAITRRADLVSIPDWLDELGQAEIGQTWGQEIAAMNSEAPVVLRANSLKISLEKLKQELENQGILTEKTTLAPDALLLTKRQNIANSQAYRDGFFEVQDLASQQVAPFLRLKAGMTVIDACAGAGGKTLHIGALMQNKGKITALDVEPRKLDELKRRARRAGLDNIHTFPIGKGQIIQQLRGTADRLLLDVPCSGLGVLRRNPDAKWKLSPDFLDNIRRTQQHIIQEYATMLKPNGMMVYATCSILPSENERQVQTFLENNPQFELLESRRLSPAFDSTDGFFMAALQRKKK